MLVRVCPKQFAVCPSDRYHCDQDDAYDCQRNSYLVSPLLFLCSISEPSLFLAEQWNSLAAVCSSILSMFLSLIPAPTSLWIMNVKHPSVELINKVHRHTGKINWPKSWHWAQISHKIDAFLCIYNVVAQKADNNYKNDTTAILPSFTSTPFSVCVYLGEVKMSISCCQ